ncbi:flagellar basal body rod protein FlgC [Bythopirellula goksoeyrii]|uniref:Flagellar basal-body rod protein FlgC n=1 Tax=Bythopirellula goksoeyrii TaxID=1400387 RepID=A0A5B9Q245_9BACT|nr:flagellar basal body rod protein FlgC [Bythopirellula goksoeyrii]QEG33058.1 Flagellar basal-body rod protein FlgC [Bythopirellula goksoeyrii]
MFNALDVSTSGLVAQRTRLNAISSNLANMSTTRNEAGEAVPYTPRFVVFKTDEEITTSGGGQGVSIDRVEYADVEPNMKYEPGHPDADANGYVAYPNIDMTTEFVDALGASRAYEANIGVIEVTKDMGERTLQILA